MNTPKLISQFCPISLYNVIYKIISKSIANRLKVVFPEIISPNQSIFVKGRQIIDNILITHEILHILMQGKSREHFMALKIDISKAYDLVEWEMIIGMMKNMGLQDKWQKWVMECM